MRTAWNSTLRPGKPPKKSPLKPRGKRWYRRKAAGLVYGEYHQHMATLPCLINDDACWGDVSGHHIVVVGQGGQDYGNEVSLCTFHHICQLHAKGQPWFERHYKRDLKSIAVLISEQYQGEVNNG